MSPLQVATSNTPRSKSNGDVQVVNDQSQIEKDGCCRSVTNKINAALESFFATVGFIIASNPWNVIGITLLISGLCILGVMELQTENRGEKNWVSQTSDPVKHKDWIDVVFPLTSRSVGMLFERKDGDNLLTKEGLTKLYDIDQMTRAIYNGTERLQWADICYSPGGLECIPSSILELWSYDYNQLSNLTDEAILKKINTPGLLSPMTGQNITVERIIGGSLVNDQARIVSASVLKVDYKLKKQDIFDSSKGRNVDKYAEEWEEEFEKTFDKSFSDYKVFTYSRWSEEHASSEASNGDLQFFVVGYILVIIYLSTMLGSFSRIAHKIFLALSGIGIIGLSIGIAYGLGSVFRLKYTDVHNVLPFLLLGIGVDDIFIIIQSWENIGGSILDDRTVPEKISQALRHSGIAVLATSVTDICAFAVGSATILPALRSFSLWCAIGILAIFLLTITLFVALLTLNARRQESRRDALLCCLKLTEDYEPLACSKTQFLKGFLKNFYAPAILSIPGKVFVLLAVAGLLGAGGYGLSELEQNFDYIWFLPSDSRPRMYIEKDRITFPGNGIAGNVYIGQIDYYNGKAEMDKIKNALENDPYISEGTVNSWYHHYHDWLIQNHYNELSPNNCTIETCQTANETRFYQLLTNFLTTKEGQNYKRRMIFEDSKIRASQFGYSHKKLVRSDEQVKAMNSITETIKPGFISDGGEALLPFAFSQLYINWETNKVISKELIRNICLATACVLVITLFLLSNIWASLMVVACVAFSLIEIAAFMGFWGLTIDTVTTIILVIAIGLTVDYSVHIAHGFLSARADSKNARATQALYEVGPAVIHGGFSTFLAFVFLVASTSYVFVTFFKVFFLVVVFGLFHGMVFLPVILSLIGPAPYADHTTVNKAVRERENHNSVKKSQQQQPNFKPSENEMTIVVDGEKNNAYMPE